MSALLWPATNLSEDPMVCTCCDAEVEKLVFAPRKDGTLQPVCPACRELIVSGFGWDELYASARTRSMDPVPDNGKCRCGAALWFVRGVLVGEAGHFTCRRCRALYRFSEPTWEPGPGMGQMRRLRS